MSEYFRQCVSRENFENALFDEIDVGGGPPPSVTI